MLCFKIPLIRILWNPIKWSWSYKQFYYNTNLWQILIFHPLIPSIKERRKSENAEGWKAQFRKKLQWFCEYLEYVSYLQISLPLAGRALLVERCVTLCGGLFKMFVKPQSQKSKLLKKMLIKHITICISLDSSFYARHGGLKKYL